MTAGIIVDSCSGCDQLHAAYTMARINKQQS